MMKFRTLTVVLGCLTLATLDGCGRTEARRAETDALARERLTRAGFAPNGLALGVVGGRIRAESAPMASLPTRSADAFRLVDRSGLTIDVTMLEAVDVPARISSDLVTYRRAFRGLADVVQRLRHDGTEDFVLLDAPLAAPHVDYQVALRDRAVGLRLVERTLEVVDAGGVPRLRVLPPEVIDALGARRAADLAVLDCAVDRDVRGPWRRAVTPPGRSACTVRVSWRDDGLRYPIVVDPAWVATGSMKEARSGILSTLLPNNLVLAISGGRSTTELYDPSSATWSAGGTMLVPQSGGAMAASPTSDRVIVTGGSYCTPVCDQKKTTQIYTASTNTWAYGADMTSARSTHSLTMLTNGKVLAAGGYVGVNLTGSTAEVYDPPSNQWTAAPSMVSQRVDHAPILLPSGKVLVSGGRYCLTGCGSMPSVSTAELYDPAGAGSWSSGGVMISAGRTSYTATLIGTKVLVVGGHVAGNYSSLAELYDIAANSWSATGSLPASLASPTAALAGGSVLLIGGRLAGNIATNAVSSYDPGTATWTVSPGLSLTRSGHGTQLLTSGKVLVFGGSDGRSVTSTAEILEPTASRPVGSACGPTIGGCDVGVPCVDGFCCDKPCAGACEACSAAKKGSGNDGTCGPIQTGSDPDAECPSATACNAGTLTGAQKCNGAGACADSGAGSCAPYLCLNTTSCRASCTLDTHCDASNYCSNTKCVARSANGVACTAGKECLSTFCVDGVCCDVACTGSCVACTTAKKGSGADGSCAPVAAGTDPDDECAQTSGYPFNCLADGQCNGAGACRPLAVTGTFCGATGAPVCSDGSLTGSLCTVAGACATSTVKCEPFTCDGAGTACRTTCASDAECAKDAFCTTTSVCKAKQPNGAACGAAKECSSGNCIDGVCCSSTCNRPCEACDVAGSEGSCVAVTGKVHGARAACAGEGTPCAGTCDGSSSACSYPSTTTACGSSCIDAKENRLSCDGKGGCTGSTAVSCGAYACDSAGKCREACTDNQGCTTGYVCSGGKCVPPVTTAKCSDDLQSSTAADGRIVPCGAYACDPSTGGCRQVCTATADCSGGNVCNSSTKTCDAPAPATEDEGGCGYAARRGGAPGGLLAVAMLHLAVRRRRRRS